VPYKLDALRKHLGPCTKEVCVKKKCELSQTKIITILNRKNKYHSQKRSYINILCRIKSSENYTGHSIQLFTQLAATTNKRWQEKTVRRAPSVTQNRA